MAELCQENVLEAQNPPLIRMTQSKNRKDQCLPLNPRTLAALKAYGLPAAKPVFGITVSTMGLHISALFADLSIAATPHTLRHSFSTTVYSRSRDLLLTQTLMGHKNCQTTMAYVELNPNEAAVNVIQSLDQ